MSKYFDKNTIQKNPIPMVDYDIIQHIYKKYIQKEIACISIGWLTRKSEYL